MTQGDVPNDVVLTEAQFREVIDRATRVDLRDSGLTVETARQVAAELNIDPVALEKALRVVLASGGLEAPVVTLPPAARGIGERLNEILPRRDRAGVFGLIAGSLGWFTAHIGNTLNTGAMAFVDVPVGIALVLLTILNSVSRRVDGSVNRFILEAASTWGAFTIAWSLTHGSVTSDLITWFASCVGAAAVWGWLFVHRKDLGPPRSPDSPDPAFMRSEISRNRRESSSETQSTVEQSVPQVSPTIRIGSSTEKERGKRSAWSAASA